MRCGPKVDSPEYWNQERFCRIASTRLIATLKVPNEPQQHENAYNLIACLSKVHIAPKNLITQRARIRACSCPIYMFEVPFTARGKRLRGALQITGNLLLLTQVVVRGKSGPSYDSIVSHSV